MAIVVRFIGEAGNFISAVDKAIKKTELFSKKSRQEFGDATKSVAKWGAATATAMAAAGLAMVKASSESAKEIKNLSQVANASVTDFQKYAFAAKTAGIESDKFSDILKDFNDRIGDFNATGAGPMVDFFEQIAPKVGVTAAQFRNLSGPQALQLYVDSLEKANLSQADMTFFLEAMASDTTALIPLLRNGGKEFQAQADQAERLGLVLSEIEIAQLEQMNQKFAILEAQTKSATDQIALGVLPVVQAMAQAIIESSEEMGGFKEIATDTMNTAVSVVGFFLDALKGVKVVFSGLGLAAAGFSVSVQSVFTETAKALAFFIDAAIDKINVLIEGSNKVNPFGDIPLIDTVTDSPFMQGLRQAQEQSETIFGLMSEDFQSLLMEKLPSERLKQFVSEAIAESDRLAEEAAAAGGGSTGDTADPLAEAQRKAKEEARAKELKAFRKSLMDEQGIEEENFQARMAQLESFNEQELEKLGGFHAAKQMLEWDHAEKMKEIKERAAKGQEKITEMSMAAQIQTTTSAMSSMLSTFGQNSKKMFKASQIAGAASALIATIQGQAEALKGPFPANLAAAATVGAAGFGFVSAIKSASMGGGGGGSAASGGPAAVPPPPPPETFNVRLQGFDRSQGVGGDQLEGVFDMINDRIRQGYQLGNISA